MCTIKLIKERIQQFNVVIKKEKSEKKGTGNPANK